MPKGCQWCQLKIQEKQKLCISAQQGTRQWHSQLQDMRITGLPVRRWVGAVHGLKQALGTGRCPPILARPLQPGTAGTPEGQGLSPSAGHGHGEPAGGWQGGECPQSAPAGALSWELYPATNSQSKPQWKHGPNPLSAVAGFLISFLSYNVALTLDFTSDF